MLQIIPKILRGKDWKKFQKCISDQLNSCIKIFVWERQRNSRLKRQYVDIVECVTSNSKESSSVSQKSDLPSTSSFKPSIPVLYENEPTSIKRLKINNQILLSDSTKDEPFHVGTDNSKSKTITYMSIDDSLQKHNITFEGNVSKGIDIKNYGKQLSDQIKDSCNQI